MRRSHALLLALPLALVACRASTSNADAVPAFLHVVIRVAPGTEVRSVTIEVGQRPDMHVIASVSDRLGRPVADAYPVIRSRQGHVVVDSTGFFYVVSPGIDYLVATLAAPNDFVAADSVQVVGQCDAVALPSISLSVADSVTGRAGELRELSMGVRDGAYRDTIYVDSVPASFPTFNRGFAFERTGTYEVFARARGYQPWSKSGVTVVVPLGSCHAGLVTLTALLRAQ